MSDNGFLGKTRVRIHDEWGEQVPWKRDGKKTPCVKVSAFGGKMYKSK